METALKQRSAETSGAQTGASKWLCPNVPVPKRPGAQTLSAQTVTLKRSCPNGATKRPDSL